MSNDNNIPQRPAASSEINTQPPATLDSASPANPLSEAIVKALFQTLPAPVLFIDPERIIRLVNPAFAELYGYTVDELIGCSTEILYWKKEDFVEIGKRLYSLYTRESIERPYDIFTTRKNGKPFIAHVRNSIVLDDAGDLCGYLTLIHDVTRERTSQIEAERLFYLSADFVAIAGFDGYFKRLSPAWESILGYDYEELLARPALSFVHPDDYERGTEHLNMVIHGAIVTDFEIRMVCQDGSVVWMSWNATPFEDEEVIYCLVRDVTEVKQAHLLRQRHTHHLQTLYSIMSVPDLSFNEQIQAILQAGLDAFGMTDSLIGKHEDDQFRITEVVPPSEQIAVESTRLFSKTFCAQVLKDDHVIGIHNVAQSSYAHLNKISSYQSYIGIPLWVNGRRYGSLKFSSDTAREPFSDAETQFMGMIGQLVGTLIARQMDRNKLAQIFNLSVDMIGVVDFEGILRQHNPAWTTILGYSSEELQDFHIPKIIQAQDLSQVSEEIKPLLAGGTIQNVEVRVMCKNGLPKWIEWSATYDPESLQIYVMGHDISIQKTLEEDLRNAYTDMEERVHERTAELELVNEDIKNFAYIVSHDLRTPLINIQGFLGELELALGEIRPVLEPQLSTFDLAKQTRLQQALAHDIPEAMDFIRSSANQMDRLIRAVLKFSRFGQRPLILSDVDTQEIVAEHLKLLAHSIAEKQVTVQIDNLPVIVADYMAMNLIFGNILSNAVTYLSADRPGKIHISATTLDYEICFRIEDNGRGIEPDDHHKVFELFRRAGDQDTLGEGVGMAYVQMLVRRHNGRIWFDSELGKGTIFYFSIPALSDRMLKD